MNRLLSKYLFYYPVTALRGEAVWKYLKEYEELQWQQPSSIDDFQNTHLHQLLQHAFDTVPYYREIAREHGLSISDFQSIEQLKLLPVTSKSEMVRFSNELHSNKRFFSTSDKTTGGSTGQAVTITKNSDALARERAATWRAYNWAGVGIGDVQARFWGTPLSSKGRIFAKAVDYISNRTRLSAFNLNQQSLESYYRKLTKLQPAYLYGYASMIADFARFILENKYRPLSGLKSVITTSEVLDENSRKLIESAFQAKVFNEYGCGEVGSIAHECEHGSMHIMADNVIIETDTSDSPDDSSGEIIVTDLHNYAMPLIRYKVGDYATLSADICACGRSLPVITKIHGRAYDVIVDPDGNRYHPEILMYIFEELKSKNMGISQFQVIQTDVDSLEVILITNTGYDENTEQIITKHIRNDIHPDFHLNFTYTDKISREKSGKLRVIKSEINS
ncbi:MAG: hypothetical protein RQ982_10555 [Gammaproteobacteria bacterium]|nr:hypothetical protein [Gammaproteobacteria bacterium]